MHNAINGQSLAQSGVGAFFGQHGISAAVGIALSIVASKFTNGTSVLFSASVTAKPSGSPFKSIFVTSRKFDRLISARRTPVGASSEMMLGDKGMLCLMGETSSYVDNS
jgi:hypothetical protein